MRLLWKLYKAGYIDLVFADEVAFQLVPSIPYGWQPTGKWIRMTPRKKKTLRVFGLLFANNRLICHPIEGQINTDFVIEALDSLTLKIERPTVVILDNAAVHRSKKLLAKRKEWEGKDLFIFYLPRYSPHLNRIETLWRKVKYEWLTPKNYRSWNSLTNSVKDILAYYGSAKYNIKFSDPFYAI